MDERASSPIQSVVDDVGLELDGKPKLLMDEEERNYEGQEDTALIEYKSHWFIKSSGSIIP